MAKEAPKKAEAAEDAPPPPKKSMKKLIIIAVAAVLVLALIGGGAAFLLKKNTHATEGEEVAAEEEPPASNYDPKKPPVFVPLEPFTVNLQPENGEQFLQVVASLRVADAAVGDQIKGFMPQIRHEVLALLGSKMPSEITTPDGREDLAIEIKDTINTILGYEPPKKKKTASKKKAGLEATGPVVAVFFTQFIVQ